jgi:hypothetical protein
MKFRIRADFTISAENKTNALLKLSECFRDWSEEVLPVFNGVCKIDAEEEKEVDDKFKRKYEDVVIPFGNFKDKMVSEVPDWYLDKCLLGQDWVAEKFEKVYNSALQERVYRVKWHIQVEE